MNGTNQIGGGSGRPQSWAELESDRNGRFQRRRPFRHPVAEHGRPGRDLGMNGTNQIGGGHVGPNPGRVGKRSERRLQRRRPFRHPVAEHERPGRDLGNERDQSDRRRHRWPQSWAELESDRNGRLQRRRPFRHPVAEHEWSGRDLGDERDQRNRRRRVGPNPGPSWLAIKA